MKTVTYTDARATLAKTMDEVVEDRAPVLITRQKGEPVVMMSLADYEALEETAYLLKIPANAERLLRSVKAVRAKKTTKRKLLPDDEAEG
jgi:antitoxin YefM